MFTLEKCIDKVRSLSSQAEPVCIVFAKTVIKMPSQYVYNSFLVLIMFLAHGDPDVESLHSRNSSSI